METKSTTDILKEAILLEQRGKAFYSNIAAQTKSEAVRKVFSMMADEEEQHIVFLSHQFAHYQKHNTFTENAAHAGRPVGGSGKAGSVGGDEGSDQRCKL